MNFIEAIRSALQSLYGNKMRAMLTMLGIIIGISSVILMSGLGAGGQQSILGDLSSSGYGNFTISIDESSEDFRSRYLFNIEEIDLLKKNKKLQYVAPEIREMAVRKRGNKTDRFFLSATTKDYEEISPATYIEGRPFLNIEYQSNFPLAVIDEVSAKEFFPEGAIGKTIELSPRKSKTKETFYIVGVFKNPSAKMASVFGGRWTPRYIRIPLKTADRFLKLDDYNKLIVKSKDPENMETAMGRATSILERNSVEGLYDVQEAISSGGNLGNILKTMNIFVTAVASISLFVGGIGVMNIMLVSVTERIKEIGIRKAIGARNRDILTQFLIESVILSLIGGVLGILFGILSGLVVGKIIKLTPIFTPTIITVSALISTLIGLIFGVVPAKKAAGLDPIEALRSE